MTNYIKKLIAAVTFAGMVCVTPVLAAAVCERGAMADFLPELEKAGASVKPVPKGVVDALVASKGQPPGVSDGEDFTVLRLSTPNGLQGQLIIVDKDGCVAWTSPLGTNQQIDTFLGVNNI